jgi:hypothetical protein
MKPGSGPRRFFFAVLAVSLSALLTLGVLEFAFWLAMHKKFPREKNLFFVLPGNIYTARGWRLPKNVNWTHVANTSGREVNFRTNSLGFRGGEVQVAKPAGTVRILMLGDSIVLSSFLPEEETFVNLVEKILASRHKVEVINAAMNDIGLRDEIEILKETGLKLKPDIVFLGFFENDSRPPWGFQNEYYTLPPRLVMTSKVLEKYSYFYKWIWMRILVTHFKSKRSVTRFDYLKDWKRGEWRTDQTAYQNLIKAADLDFGAGWDQKAWLTIYSDLDELRAIAAKNNFKLVIAVFPVSIQVQSQFGDDYPQKKMKEYCQKNNIPLLDLLPVLRPHKDEDIFFDLCHYTPQGNQIIAPTIAEFLEKAIPPN